jgi:hypothetical protein
MTNLEWLVEQEFIIALNSKIIENQLNVIKLRNKVGGVMEYPNNVTPEEIILDCLETIEKASNEIKLILN